MKLLMIAAAAVALTTAGTAAAQTPPPASAPPAAGKVDAAEFARRKALALRYIELIGMRKTMMAMLPQLFDAMPARDTGAIDQETASRIALEAYDAVMPEYLDYAAGVYAEIFSETELQALVDFYSGPGGQAIIAKAPAVGARTSDFVAFLQPRLFAEIRRRVETELQERTGKRAA